MGLDGNCVLERKNQKGVMGSIFLSITMMSSDFLSLSEVKRYCRKLEMSVILPSLVTLIFLKISEMNSVNTLPFTMQ